MKTLIDHDAKPGEVYEYWPESSAVNKSQCWEVMSVDGAFFSLKKVNYDRNNNTKVFTNDHYSGRAGIWRRISHEKHTELYHRNPIIGWVPIGTDGNTPHHTLRSRNRGINPARIYTTKALATKYSPVKKAKPITWSEK